MTRALPLQKFLLILQDCQGESSFLGFQNVPFVHTFEQASHNGELVHAVEAGRLRRDDVSQLGDVLVGTAEGRTSDGDITIFDSTGLAIQDLAIALAAMERAAELNPPTIDL